MTTFLQQAYAEAAKRTADEQDLLASWLFDELAAENVMLAEIMARQNHENGALIRAFLIAE